MESMSVLGNLFHSKSEAQVARAHRNEVEGQEGYKELDRSDSDGAVDIVAD